MKDIEQKILDRISPDVEPDYKNIYALVEKSSDATPEFIDAVIDKLRDYDWIDPYYQWIQEYESEQDAILSEASKRYKKEVIEGAKRTEKLSISKANENVPRAGDLPVEIKSFNPISMTDLIDMDIPPIEFLVNDIFPKGLGILSAPPKYYKSFLALQVCIAICTHNKFLNRDTSKYTCLYLDLESGNRRPRDRASKIIENMGVNIPDNLYVVTLQTDTVKTINEGFVDTLTATIKQHENVGLVVIDVFQKIRNGSKRGQTSYQYDYEELTPLKQCCEENNLSILLVHHNKKGKENDIFNNMSGSTALLGACDFAWVIEKDRLSRDATLYVTGRDIESVELTIHFNEKLLLWEYLGTQQEIEDQRLSKEYHQSSVISTIKKLVDDHDGVWEGSVNDIKKASSYFGCEIYDSEQAIGKKINEYSELLLGIDRIEINTSRTSKKRIIKFIRH